MRTYYTIFQIHKQTIMNFWGNHHFKSKMELFTKTNFNLRFLIELLNMSQITLIAYQDMLNTLALQIKVINLQIRAVICCGLQLYSRIDSGAGVSCEFFKIPSASRNVLTDTNQSLFWLSLWGKCNRYCQRF